MRYGAASLTIAIRRRLRQSRFLRWTTIAAGAVVTGGIGWLDHYTGPSLELAPLYLFPVVGLSVALGARYGLTFAAIDAAIDNLDELLMRVHGGFALAPITYRMVRVVTYIAIAMLVARAAQDAEELDSYATRLRDAMELAERDVESAARLQRSLINDDTPIIPGLDVAARLSYASRVGGDYLHVQQADGRLFLCVGDISGKGIPAALFTTAVKNLLRHATGVLLPPKETLAYLNHELHELMPPEMFISMICGYVDPETKVLTYASAGHEPALLLRNTGSVERLGPTGTVLALTDDTRFEEASLPMEDGEILLFYTDGVTELRLDDGGRLGQEGLEELLRAQASANARQMVEGIFQSLVAREGRWPRDDITLLAVRIGSCNENPQEG